MKDIHDMGIGESFYLKNTVVTISTRTGMPCEFDEERIDINDLIIAELEKIKAEMNVELFKEYSAEREFDSGYESCLKKQIDRIDNHIKELKGESNE